MEIPTWNSQHWGGVSHILRKVVSHYALHTTGHQDPDPRIPVSNDWPGWFFLWKNLLCECLGYVIWMTKRMREKKKQYLVALILV